MKLNDFKFLEQLPTKGFVILKNGKNYAEAIYESNIPFRPGVYLVYSLNKKGEDQDLLYYGKAGVTDNKGNPTLNYHQLPKRLVATTSIPSNHPEFEKKKDITRAKLWTWYVENKFVYGIKIYWFISEWPKQNPNDIERKIKEEIKQKYPKWKKSI
ncbi:MAG: hypothetical protein ACK4R6_07885 [Spirosomataceae bacterium]